MEENKHFTIDWTNCRLCPRECGADRTRGFGACKVGNTITAARAALHMWEEPCMLWWMRDQELYFFQAVI